MLVSDSDQQLLFLIFKEKTLVAQAQMDDIHQCKRPTPPHLPEAEAEANREGVVDGDEEIHDVEEGEISDSSASSLEEITQEAFAKKDKHKSRNKDPPSSVVPIPPVSSSSTVAPTTITSNTVAVVAASNNNINNINSCINGNSNSKTRVWTMQDLYKYSGGRNYSSGLYNLAWAQAVQNKPLDELFKEFKPDNNNNSNSDEKSDMKKSGLQAGSVINNDDSSNEKVVIDLDNDDDVREDGELEEGEIHMDSDAESIEIKKDPALEEDAKKVNPELEKQVDLLRVGLASVTEDGARNSFGEVCSGLQKLLVDLQDMLTDKSFSEKDDILQQAITSVQTVYSAFCSMNTNQKEQNKEKISRLFTNLKSEKIPLFSPQQLKEMEITVSSSDHKNVFASISESDKDRLTEVIEANVKTSADLSHLKKYIQESKSVESLNQNENRSSMKNLKPAAATKHRALLPLLDLHKDHDVDSLPSPTRETPPQFPVHLAPHVAHGVGNSDIANMVSTPGHRVQKFDPIDKPFTVAQEVMEPHLSAGVPHIANATTHPYETEALKAVSSYQQKFGRSSFFMTDRLPSPTPSEDGNNDDGDTGGEVSSSSIFRNTDPTNSLIAGRPTTSRVSSTDISGGRGLSSARTAGLMNFGPPVIKSSSAKSRDPRLRVGNSDLTSGAVNQQVLPVVTAETKIEPFGVIMGMRKQKTADEQSLDGPALKRQRNESTDSVIVNEVQAPTSSGKWLENSGTVGFQPGNSNSVLGNAENIFRKVEQSVSSAGSIVKDPRKLECGVSSASLSSVMSTTTVIGNENLGVAGPSSTPSLHSLLKDIAVNPSIWMNILKMEQKKSADISKGSGTAPNLNSILGAAPPTTVGPSKPSVSAQVSAGTLQTSQHTFSADNLGKVRMKPRDPRRILHSTALEKAGGIGPDRSKMATSTCEGTTENLSVQRQADQLDKKSVSSTVGIAPDIARQFTKNLKTIADIISVSEGSISPTSVAQVSVPQPGFPSQAVVSESGSLQTGNTMVSKDGVPVASRPQTWGDVEHLFEGFDDQQKAAIQRERARRIEEQKKMFAVRKLCLVLDLDHTLLNSAKFVEVDPAHDEILRKKEEQDREKPYRHLFRFPHMGMWTKLRPGIWNFLEKASKLYELHLYTMGNKLYATEMAKLLDPKGELFAGRVISRGDDGDLVDGKSKDLEGVLGMESAVVIIDDSVRVWPHNKLNLIVVERYIYFPCSRRQFGLPGPSLLEIDHDERPEQGTLASSLAVIERIHQSFFAHQSLDEADVRNILASEQRKILAGCRILFSRVFPVGEANPHMHPLWQTAEQFGAVCTNQIDEEVTHVVANAPGTDKVNWALSSGRFVVHPGWVEASALLYRRANENDFAIKP